MACLSFPEKFCCDTGAVENCRLQGNLPPSRNKLCLEDLSVGTPVLAISPTHPEGQREESYSTTAFPTEYAIPPSSKAPARGPVISVEILLTYTSFQAPTDRGRLGSVVTEFILEISSSEMSWKVHSMVSSLLMLHQSYAKFAKEQFWRLVNIDSKLSAKNFNYM
ncbi:hypothetical protein llap_10703 [Limosa lapponica baueri]|uniref:Uncharacterized protein n=1 Tax=Limosa lapponica baueri TaxID=1758121 RepID=A0A2I0TYY9_LIMLA|nr:hypothetical protein llap_10703 [Limosa lapponica baueri]